MIYRIMNNIYANVEGKDVNIGYVCIDNDHPNDFRTLRNFTNSEVIQMRLNSQIYDDGSRWCSYHCMFSIKDNKLLGFSNLDAKWIVELHKLGYNISSITFPDNINLRYHRCDHCGKIILEDDECYSDGIHCAYYCSITCLALDQMYYVKKRMTKDILDEIDETNNLLKSMKAKYESGDKIW